MARSWRGAKKRARLGSGRNSKRSDIRPGPPSFFALSLLLRRLLFCADFVNFILLNAKNRLQNNMWLLFPVSYSIIVFFLLFNFSMGTAVEQLMISWWSADEQLMIWRYTRKRMRLDQDATWLVSGVYSQYIPLRNYFHLKMFINHYHDWEENSAIYIQF